MRLTEDPHRRLNALTNEWVLVSPHRATRPWQGEVAKLKTTPEPQYDPACYLCPGNARAGGVRNPKYETTFVFENDFSALKPQTPHERIDTDKMGLLVAEGERGDVDGSEREVGDADDEEAKAEEERAGHHRHSDWNGPR